MAMHRVGSNVDGYCTKCKLTLAHTIEAIVEGTIRKVHCNTCKSRHTFRAHAPGEAPAKTASASRRATRTVALPKSGNKRGGAGLVKASDYSNLMKGRNFASARSYSFRDKFKTGEVVSHTTFGLGIVTADKGADKIEVLFELGPKTLVHGKSL